MAIQADLKKRHVCSFVTARYHVTMAASKPGTKDFTFLRTPPLQCGHLNTSTFNSSLKIRATVRLTFTGNGLFVEKLQAGSQKGFAISACQKSVMPDAHKSLWQHMQQEAAYKFYNRQFHVLCFIAVSVIPVPEAYLSVFKRDNTLVCYGDPVSVLPEVLDYRFG